MEVIRELCMSPSSQSSLKCQSASLFFNCQQPIHAPLSKTEQGPQAIYKGAEHSLRLLPLKDERWQSELCAQLAIRLLIASYCMWRRCNFKRLSQAKSRGNFLKISAPLSLIKNFGMSLILVRSISMDSTFKKYGLFTLLFAMKNDPIPLAHKFTRHLAKKQR